MIAKLSAARSNRFERASQDLTLNDSLASASIAILPIEGVSASGSTGFGEAEVSALIIDPITSSEVAATGQSSLTLSSDVAAKLIQDDRCDHLVVHVRCGLLEHYEQGEFRCRVTVGRRFSDAVFFSNFRRAHAFLIPLWLMTDLGDGERITLTVNALADLDLDPDSIPFDVRLFACAQDKLEESIEEKIVFVFSSARSGSTWVASDIMGWRHERRLIDEPGIGQCFAPLRWDAERFYQLPDVPYMESGLDYETRLKERSSENESELPLVPFARLNAESTGPDGFFNKWYRKDFYENIRRQILHQIIAEWGILDYRQVCIKMPNESQAADFLLKALPSSRAIHLIRDGRDVLSSRFGAFGSGILAQSTDKDLRRHAIAFYSHLWNFQNDIIESALDTHDASRSMRVRYEDIRADPETFVETLFRWLGQKLTRDEVRDVVAKSEYRNMPAEEVGYGKRRGDGTIGRYKKVFSEAEIELMDRIMGPLLKKYNYEAS
jgi:hypothetical protein